MTNTRQNIPSVNLKDRIAALQQREALDSQHHPPSLIPTPRSVSGQHTGSLRDKIANFEKKGAVPVPRGSFGIGAPPVDDGSSRRKGELYGNRIPGLSKPSLISVPVSLPGSSYSRRRTTSASHAPNSNIEPRSRSVTPTSAEFHHDSFSDTELSPSSPPSSSSSSRFSPRLPSSLISPHGRRAASDVWPPRRQFSQDSVEEILSEAGELEGVSEDVDASAVAGKEHGDEEEGPSEPHTPESSARAELVIPGTPVIIVSPEPTSPAEDQAVPAENLEASSDPEVVPQSLSETTARLPGDSDSPRLDISVEEESGAGVQVDDQNIVNSEPSSPLPAISPGPVVEDMPSADLEEDTLHDAPELAEEQSPLASPELVVEQPSEQVDAPQGVDEPESPTSRILDEPAIEQSLSQADSQVEPDEPESDLSHPPSPGEASLATLPDSSPVVPPSDTAIVTAVEADASLPSPAAEDPCMDSLDQPETPGLSPTTILYQPTESERSELAYLGSPTSPDSAGWPVSTADSDVAHGLDPSSTPATPKSPKGHQGLVVDVDPSNEPPEAAPVPHTGALPSPESESLPSPTPADPVTLASESTTPDAVKIAAVPQELLIAPPHLSVTELSHPSPTPSGISSRNFDLSSSSRSEGVISPVVLSPLTPSSQISDVFSPLDLQEFAPLILNPVTDDNSTSSETNPSPEDATFSAGGHGSKKDANHNEPFADEPSVADESFSSLANTSLALDAQEAILVSSPPVLVTASPATRTVLSPMPETPLPKRQPVVNLVDVADESFSSDADLSLALDTKDAIIVSEPAQAVSPTVTRGVLIPAPKSSSPPSKSGPPPSSVPAAPLESPSDPLFNSRETRKSFRAVVHKKVREGSGTSSDRNSSSRQSRLTTTPVTVSRKPSTNRPPPVVVSEPEPSNITDLAALLADAALLEQQLSTGVSPRQNSNPPAPPVQEVPPEPPTPTQLSPGQFQLQQDIPEDAVGEDEDDEFSTAESAPRREEHPLALPPRNASLPSSNPTVNFPDSPLWVHTKKAQVPLGSKSTPDLQVDSQSQSSGSRLQGFEGSPPPPPPPKSPKLRFSSFRIRKPTMPGAYPRGSYSSDDSAVHVSNPPSDGLGSAPQDHEGVGSDTSSIRSSSKSWKSPKSGLGRASSFAGRLWTRGKNKDATPVETSDDDRQSVRNSVAQRSASPAHLSPYNVPSASRSRETMPPQQRPTSWVSISTTGSGGDVFDTDLFDSFPSVPDTVPPLPPTPSSFHSLNGNGHRQHLSTYGGEGSDFGTTANVTNRATTLPVPRSKSHTKQHSAMI